MFAEDLSAVWELALQSLTQDGVEWFILSSADIQTTEREGNDLFEAFEVIGSFGSLPEILRRERPDIDYSLYRTARFKDFNGEGDVCNGESLHKGHCQLLNNIY